MQRSGSQRVSNSLKIVVFLFLVIAAYLLRNLLSIPLTLWLGMGFAAGAIGIAYLTVRRRRRRGFSEGYIRLYQRSQGVRSSSQTSGKVTQVTHFRKRDSPASSSRCCPSCGASVVFQEASRCLHCGAQLKPPISIGFAADLKTRPAKIGTCMVCGFRFDRNETVSRCPHCGNMAHRRHILEWLHVKDYCPACGHHLEEQDLG